MKQHTPFFFLILIIISCSVTSDLKKGQSVLVENHVFMSKEDDQVDHDIISNLIDQKANVSLGGWYYGVWLKYLNSNLGEELAVFNQRNVESSKENIKNYLKKTGYLNAQVKDSVVTKEEETKVFYYIKPGNRSYVTSIKYQISQNELKKIIENDSANSLIKLKDSYDEELLVRERDRLSLLLKNSGYYTFSKSSIEFEADTTGGKVELDFIIKTDSLKPFTIGSVKFYINPDDRLRPNHRQNFKYKERYKGIDYFYETYNLSRTVLALYNDIKPGTVYNYSLVDRTHKKLGNLGAVSSVGITPIMRENQVLDMEIFILPRKKQSYSAAIEGTNVSGNIGFATRLGYVHHNSLLGSNRFSINLSSSLEFVTNQDNITDKSIKYGGYLSYEIPMIFPFRFTGDNNNYIPKTNIDLSVDLNERPEYNRLRSTFSTGYKWKSSRFSSHNLQLVTLNIISIDQVNSQFLENAKKLNLESSYQNTFISSSSYSYSYSDRTSIKDYTYNKFYSKVEASGNTLSLYSDLIDDVKEEDSYQIFGIDYSQYIKFDFEFKKYWDLGSDNVIAARFGMGVALPYGNMLSLPVDKQYQAGGYNDIRAWKSRSLGPGSFALEDQDGNIKFYNQLSDMKLLANLEYRFPIYGVFRGAIFADAGNIWALSTEDDREGARFEFDSFYREIAIGSGTGLRIDFDFIQLAFDWGIKIYNPKSSLTNNWVIQDDELIDLSVFNFGINYPF